MARDWPRERDVQAHLGFDRLQPEPPQRVQANEPGPRRVQPAPAQPGSISGLQSILTAALSHLSELVEADVYQVFLAGEDRLLLRAEAPQPRTGTGSPMAIDPQTGFATRLLRLSIPLKLDDTDSLQGHEQEWAARGFRKVAGVSFTSARDPVTGLLVCARTGDDAFEEMDLGLLAHLGAELSQALGAYELCIRAEAQAVLAARTTLARDIHDGLASDLSGIVSLLKYHEQRSGEDPVEADKILAQVRELAEAALQSAREVISSLRPRLGPGPAVGDAVRRHTYDFARTYSLTAMVTILGEDDSVSREEREVIFQVLREALTNVRKHAAAKTVEVHLDMRHQPFVLSVEDDGVGLGAGALDKSGSYGLVGMRERAELLGAVLDVEAGSRGGTRVVLSGGWRDGTGPGNG